MKPVVFDGLLWFIIGVSGAAIAELGSETAFKYISPYTLFWWKFTMACLLAGATSLKTYRSTGYAAHLDKQKTDLALANGNDNKTVTTTDTKTTTTGTVVNDTPSVQEVQTQQPKGAANRP